MLLIYIKLRFRSLFVEKVTHAFLLSLDFRMHKFLEENTGMHNKQDLVRFNVFFARH